MTLCSVQFERFSKMAPGGSDGKLSALEQKIHKVGMAAPNAVSLFPLLVSPGALTAFAALDDHAE